MSERWTKMKGIDKSMAAKSLLETKDECKCKKVIYTVLAVVGAIAAVAAIAYAVYYFFFADEYEEFDEEFFFDDDDDDLFKDETEE